MSRRPKTEQSYRGTPGTEGREVNPLPQRTLTSSSLGTGPGRSWKIHPADRQVTGASRCRVVQARRGGMPPPLDPRRQCSPKRAHQRTRGQERCPPSHAGLYAGGPTTTGRRSVWQMGMENLPRRVKKKARIREREEQEWASRSGPVTVRKLDQHQGESEHSAERRDMPVSQSEQPNPPPN